MALNAAPTAEHGHFHTRKETSIGTLDELVPAFPAAPAAEPGTANSLACGANITEIYLADQAGASPSDVAGMRRAGANRADVLGAITASASPAKCAQLRKLRLHHDQAVPLSRNAADLVDVADIWPDLATRIAVWEARGATGDLYDYPALRWVGATHDACDPLTAATVARQVLCAHLDACTSSDVSAIARDGSRCRRAVSRTGLRYIA